MKTEHSGRITWMRCGLVAAAVYHLVAGIWIASDSLGQASGDGITQWESTHAFGSSMLWRWIGLSSVAWGVGYGIAAARPLKYWPIVMLGLIGKTMSLLGLLVYFAVHGTQSLFAAGAASSSISASWIWALLIGDTVWLFLFATILYQTFKTLIQPPRSAEDLSYQDANHRYLSQHENRISELSKQSPVLVVFLRHSGCTFCREALQDLSDARESIESNGTKIVLVHMGVNEKRRIDLQAYGLSDVDCISDPGCQLYRAYQLDRGKFHQLFGPAVWWRGFLAAIVNRHGVGKLEGDGFQMPGVFLVQNNQIVRSFRHRTPASRPDYCELSVSDKFCST